MGGQSGKRTRMDWAARALLQPPETASIARWKDASRGGAELDSTLVKKSTSKSLPLMSEILTVAMAVQGTEQSETAQLQVYSCNSTARL